MRVSLWTALRRGWLAGLLLAVSAFAWAGARPARAAHLPPLNYPVFLPLTVQQVPVAWAWQEPQALNLDPPPLGEPQILLDAAGQAQLFWQGAAAPGNVLIYHRRQTASGWSAAAPVARLAGSARLWLPPQITPDGQVHLVWEQRLPQTGPLPSAPYRLLAASYAAAGWPPPRWFPAGWSPPVELTRAVAPLVPGGLNVNDAGQLQLVYFQPEQPLDPYVYLIRGAAGWGAPQRMLPPELFGVVWKFAFPDPAGGVDFFGAVTDDPTLAAFGYWRFPDFPPGHQLNWGGLWEGRGLLDAASVYHQARLTAVAAPGGAVRGVEHQCLPGVIHAPPPQVISGAGAALALPLAAQDRGAGLVYAWPQAEGYYLGRVQDCQPQPPQPLPERPAWSRLAALALSATPRRVCVLGALAGTPRDFELLCADLSA